jgi:hypothetical protein
MIVLGAEPSSEPLPQSDATPERQDSDTAAAPDAVLLSELRARISDLENDRDHWRQTAADLSRNLSEVTGTLTRSGLRTGTTRTGGHRIR